MTTRCLCDEVGLLGLHETKCAGFGSRYDELCEQAAREAGQVTNERETMTGPITTPEELLASVGRTQMPLADALATLAENVADLDGVTVKANIHGLPLDFFARADVSNVRSNLSHDKRECYLTGDLDLGGHSFDLFSRHFPTEAKPD